MEMGLFSKGVDQSSQLFNGILWIQGLTRRVCVDNLSTRSQFKVHLDVGWSTSVLGEVQEGSTWHVFVEPDLQHPGGVVLEFV